MRRRKKDWLNKNKSIENIVLALYVAVILLVIEAIRFCISMIISPKLHEIIEIQSYFITWGIAIIILTIFIRGFSNNLEKQEAKKKEDTKKSKFKNFIKKTFSFSRVFKGFLFAVIIGLGAHLGEFFLRTHWLIALIVVTLIMVIFAGKLLDLVFDWD